MADSPNNPPDSGNTFQDILLELMVANECLQKLEKNTSLLAEKLTPGETKTVEKVESVEKIQTIEKIKEIEQIGKSTENTGGTLSAAAPIGDSGLATFTAVILNKLDELIAATSWNGNVLEAGFDSLGVKLTSLDRGLDAIIETMERDRLQRLEDAREAKNTRPSGAVVPKAPRTEGGLGGLGGILGAVAIVGGLIAGFIAGVISSITQVLSKTWKAIKAILNVEAILSKIGITRENIAKIFEPFAKIKDSIANFFKDTWTNFKKIFSESTILKSIKGFFKPITDLFTGEGSFFAKIGEVFASLKETFGKFISKFSKFFAIGKVIGKLTGWIGMAWSVFESISDAVDVFKKTGDWSKTLETGVTGIINSFIGGPLDLLKDITSWILGKLGFKEVENFLDSFSISDIISTFVGRITKWGREAFESIFVGIFDAVEDIKDGFQKGPLDAILGILRGVSKTLLAIPADLVKNTMANLLGMFGASSAENWLRSFSFQKMFGGTHTSTESEQKTNGKSVLEEASDKTVERKTTQAVAKAKKEEADKLKADTDKKEKEGKSKLDAIKNPIEEFYNALIKAYQENASGKTADGTVISPQSVTAGAVISAMQNDTATAKEQYEAQQTQQLIPQMPKTAEAPRVSNQSVTYNTNNVPDRTSWLTMPVSAMVAGF